MIFAAKVRKPLPAIRLLCGVMFCISRYGWAQIPTTEKTDGGEVPVPSRLAHFSFDEDVRNSVAETVSADVHGDVSFTTGINQHALRIDPGGGASFVAIDGEDLALSTETDFSVQFWIRTTIDSRKKMVVLSKKEFPDNSLQSQKQKGWAFGVFNGTWAWNIGSGTRRMTYERDNGNHMPINDGRWHQFVMTYDHSSTLVRLYCDGVNWVTYNVSDKDGFDFSTTRPMVVGWDGNTDDSKAILPAIVDGRKKLQDVVDAFGRLGLPGLTPDELMDLVIAPNRLAETKLRAGAEAGNGDAPELPDEDLKSIERLARGLMQNPYTIHQVADFMNVAPLLRLYRLSDGRVMINEKAAWTYTRQERLSRPDFDIDELSIWNRPLGHDEVLHAYAQHFPPVNTPLDENVDSLTAASFNIHHGGKHQTTEQDGWDSRLAIARLIERENIDVVLMQETYSSGDFLAAELGYYFATTVDWDYLNQGANISVLSRYPIREVHVPPKSSFMNLCARVSLSKKQDLYAMSNWYGMSNFSDVFEYHRARISEADKIPILFAGDFNAVPHTDGGSSPASRTLSDAGFTDAFRDQYPDVAVHPGPTHQSGRRIDQLFYRGSGLRNTSTEVLSEWPTIFPSDHYLIKSTFVLDDASHE